MCHWVLHWVIIRLSNGWWKTDQFPLMQLYLKLSAVVLPPFCLGGDELNYVNIYWIAILRIVSLSHCSSPIFIFSYISVWQDSLTIYHLSLSVSYILKNCFLSSMSAFAVPLETCFVYTSHLFNAFCVRSISYVAEKVDSFFRKRSTDIE